MHTQALFWPGRGSSIHAWLARWPVVFCHECDHQERAIESDGRWWVCEWRRTRRLVVVVWRQPRKEEVDRRTRTTSASKRLKVSIFATSISHIFEWTFFEHAEQMRGYSDIEMWWERVKIENASELAQRKLRIQASRGSHKSLEGLEFCAVNSWWILMIILLEERRDRWVFNVWRNGHRTAKCMLCRLCNANDDILSLTFEADSSQGFELCGLNFCSISMIKPSFWREDMGLFGLHVLCHENVNCMFYAACIKNRWEMGKFVCFKVSIFAGPNHHHFGWLFFYYEAMKWGYLG